MEITQKKVGRACVVTPQVKKIDASVAVEFRKQLLDLVAAGEHRLVLNLGGVDFIDSSGLGALVSVLKNIGPEGRIKLFAVKDGVRSIFELTRLDRMFDIHISEKGAVEDLK
jgi:anti-sigma B factor antagonist